MSYAAASPSNDDPLHAPLLPPPPPAATAAAGGEAQAKSEPVKICIDRMLQKYCGEFGPWQLRHFVLTSLAWSLEAFHTMVMIFADREPAWRCTDAAVGRGCDRAATGLCGMDRGSWEWAKGGGSSTVTEWGLVCGEKYKVGLVQALFFGGCMIGTALFFTYLLNHRVD